LNAGKKRKSKHHNKESQSVMLRSKMVLLEDKI
jgi:hypothetical protein